MPRPTGVTVIAVLQFIGSALWLCLGLVLLLAGGVAGAAIARSTGLGAAFVAGIAGAMGVFALCMAAIAGLTGWGMLNLKEWARIVTLFFAGLNVLFGLFSLLRIGLVGGVLRIAIAGVVIWYLTQPQIGGLFRNRSGVVAA